MENEKLKTWIQGHDYEQKNADFYKRLGRQSKKLAQHQIARLEELHLGASQVCAGT